MFRKLLLILLLGMMAFSVAAQDNFVFGDPLPTAPELAARGEYGVGVRTLALVNPDQADLLNMANDPAATYDRELMVEVWYPATIPDGEVESVIYEDSLGRADVEGSLRPFTFEGRALRDAEPDNSAAAYPLVIISHGYPGSRLMMSYLAENIASKGYVVAAIGHTESTYQDVTQFGSTLLNRTKDQRFVIDAMAEQNTGDDFLSGMLDADNTAIIGYSMGGYGALNTIGAGYNAMLGGFLGPVADPILAENTVADERVKAAVVFAPWGNDLSAVGAPGAGFWDAETLGNITVPTFWVVGSQDDVAMYGGVVGLFDSAVNSERYLLVYENALHNVAPNPPPVEAQALGDYERYAEPAWDERHINNVNQHFVTAFLGQYLKGEDYSTYLNPAVENANDGVVSLDEAGNPTEDYTYWTGFQPRTAPGLILRVAGN